MKIINVTKATVLVTKVEIADTMISRMVGLLNRDSLGQDEAIVITKCKSIHMFFMRFPIDVIFVDRENHIVGVVERIKPFRLSPTFFKASYAIELAEGMVGRSHSTVGDTLKIM